MRKSTLLVGLGIGVTAYFVLDNIHRVGTRQQAISMCNSLPQPKLNIGAAGKNQPVMKTALLNDGKKCDISPDCSKGIEFCDLQQALPYPDKHFGCVFASHVLEHIPSYYVRYALSEMERISNNQVIVVLPHPLSLTFYIASGHKSLIYKKTNPYYGLSVKNNSRFDNTNYNDTIALNPDIFKVFQ